MKHSNDKRVYVGNQPTAKRFKKDVLAPPAFERDDALFNSAASCLALSPALTSWWRIVFEKLLSPQDAGNLILTCKYFYYLVQNEYQSPRFSHLTRNLLGFPFGVKENIYKRPITRLEYFNWILKFGNISQWKEVQTIQIQFLIESLDKPITLSQRVVDFLKRAIGIDAQENDSRKIKALKAKADCIEQFMNIEEFLNNFNKEILCSYINTDALVLSSTFNFQKITRIPATLLCKPDLIAYWENLRELNLSSNNLMEIPENIGILKNLEVLNLNMNRISYFAPELTKLTALRHLSLSCNELLKIPGIIAELRSLTELDLSINSVHEIPETLTNLKNLNRLSLSGNKFTRFPAILYRFTELRHIDLSFNRIESLPDEMPEQFTNQWRNDLLNTQLPR